MVSVFKISPNPINARNINGTEDNGCTCGTWVDHWNKFSEGSWPEKCSVVGCDKPAGVGAHVLKDGDDNHWYIIPLCSGCNGKHGETVTVEGDTEFISANKSATCGKNTNVDDVLRRLFGDS